jgi:hypothetical protein
LDKPEFGGAPRNDDGEIKPMPQPA